MESLLDKISSKTPCVSIQVHLITVAYQRLHQFSQGGEVIYI